MSADRFVTERGADWVALEALVGRAGPRAARLDAGELLDLGRRYRAAAADLALARRRYPGDPAVARLEPVVAGARDLLYGTPTRRASVLDWVTRGFWWRVRERPAALLAAALLLLVPMLGFGWWAHADPVSAARFLGITPLGAEVQQSADLGYSVGESAAFSSAIFTNNVRVALFAFALGITGGLGTAAILAYNGFSVGLLGGLLVAAGGGDRFFRLVLPHGLLELSLIVVAGAAGLRMGWALVHPGLRSRGAALRDEARAAAEMALGCALLLVPTGLVEGFVTPRGLSVVAAAAVGAVLAGTFWVLVLWRGRPAPEP